MSNATTQAADSSNTRAIASLIDKLPFVHQRIFLRALFRVMQQPAKPLQR